MTKRVLIVEDGLIGLEVGHWYQHVRTISNACRNAGYQVDIAAFKGASQQLVNDLEAQPLLPVSAWTGGSRPQSILARPLRVIQHNFLLYREVRKLLLKSPQPYHCVFAPTVLINHLIAWKYLIEKYGGKQFRQAVLFFLNPPGQYSNSDNHLVFPSSSRLMRDTLLSLKPHLAAGTVRLGVETVRTAQHFKVFCGLDFEVTPQPVSLEKLNHLPRSGKPLFASYGFARHEKGSDLLQAALILLLERNGQLPARFLIQWRDDFGDETGRPVVRSPYLLQCTDVEFTEQAFDTAEYTHHLSITDAVVLPYRRRSYYDRDSRVAIEAAILGIPTVYTRDTWLEQCANYCGAGTGFNDEDVTGLAHAIDILARDIDSYQRDASAHASKARDYFAPEHFQRWLLDSHTPYGLSAPCVLF